jgi:hypothetical protein
MRTGLAGNSGIKGMFDGGFILIYSGGQPVSADAAETGVLLCRVATGSYAGGSGTGGLKFGTAADGVIPKSSDVWSGTIGVAGVAGYFRFLGTGGTTGQMGSSGTSGTGVRLDGNVGMPGSDLVLANTSLVLGATLTIDQFSLNVPISA